MRAFATTALLVAVAATLAGCGSGSSGAAQLPKPLSTYVKSLLTDSAGNTVKEIDVYGPGSRTALVKTAMGDVVNETAKERSMRFYLVVSHGSFICNECLGPRRQTTKPPTYTIEARAWSPQEGTADFATNDGLPAAVSSLHRLAVVKPS